MVLTVTGLGLPLVILKVLVALVVPIGTAPKARLAGVVVTGAAPVPVRLTKASRFLLGSDMLAAPVMDPTSVGVKKSCAVQEPPLPGILLPQLSVSVKSPLITIGLMRWAAGPLFVIVTPFAGVLVVPTP